MLVTKGSENIVVSGLFKRRSDTSKSSKFAVLKCDGRVRRCPDRQRLAVTVCVQLRLLGLVPVKVVR